MIKKGPSKYTRKFLMMLGAKLINIPRVSRVLETKRSWHLLMMKPCNHKLTKAPKKGENKEQNKRTHIQEEQMNHPRGQTTRGTLSSRTPSKLVYLMDRPSNTWIPPGFKTLKGATIKVSKLEVGLELTTYPFRQLTTITLPFIMLKMFAAGSASLNRKATREHTLT